ncbi:MAG: gluconate 2-dehydrogenase subunit 3 family protein [Gemmatimonadota bacterium]
MNAFPFSRRTFLGALAATVPFAWVVRAAHATAVDAIESDERTLRALGEAILPSALGAHGNAASVHRFQRWIAGYRENAELLHGYGTSAIEHSGPTPATRWAAQLVALDEAARRTHKRAFSALAVEERRNLVQADLALLKAERIPALGKAPHVALALLAHFYASPEATDLCYEAAILKQNCRPLAAASRRPLPLAPVRRA